MRAFLFALQKSCLPFMILASTQLILKLNAHASSQSGLPILSRPLSKTNLAAGAKVPLWTALPFPRLLLLFPDRVHTPRNTSAISL